MSNGAPERMRMLTRPGRLFHRPITVGTWRGAIQPTVANLSLCAADVLAHGGAACRPTLIFVRRWTCCFGAGGARTCFGFSLMLLSEIKSSPDSPGAAQLYDRRFLDDPPIPRAACRPQIRLRFNWRKAAGCRPTTIAAAIAQVAHVALAGAALPAANSARICLAPENGQIPRACSALPTGSGYRACPRSGGSLCRRRLRRGTCGT
jgi:hypothetical protein